ncbi:Uncharacterised protein [Shigella sonnei]|nr:Uncharacterised protein [Shigella sonnei]CSG14911.1 Uncharacterised protein [Shigella sonnei]CSG24715.1 Uncharacterised protein [Shigella sonnei]CSP81313.1 Uncharacterised protein [Shigella sonnei]
MVIFFAGYSYPLLIMALRTRSRASFTVVSGKPTIVKPGRPLLICTSTVIRGRIYSQGCAGMNN